MKAERFGRHAQLHRGRTPMNVQRNDQGDWPTLAVWTESSITKTYLYNFDTLKPHFYIVKLGFPRVYINFLISAQKHRLWGLVRIGEAVVTRTHNLCLGQKCKKKYRNFLSENFPFLVVKFSIYLNRRVFVMLVCTYIWAIQLSNFGSNLSAECLQTPKLP